MHRSTKATRAAAGKYNQQLRDLKNEVFELKQALHKVTAERDLARRAEETRVPARGGHDVASIADVVIEIARRVAR